MINLLPPEEKEELLLKKKEMLITVLAVMVLVCLFCLVLVLASVKFYILGEASSQKIILDTIEKQYETSDFTLLRESVNKYNASLSAMDTFYKKQKYIGNPLRTILELKKPNGLYFNAIMIDDAKEGAGFNAAISGISDTRDGLSDFKDILESNQAIKNIDFPPQSWIKSASVNFHVTFEIEAPTGSLP